MGSCIVPVVLLYIQSMKQGLKRAQVHMSTYTKFVLTFIKNDLTLVGILWLGYLSDRTECMGQPQKCLEMSEYHPLDHKSKTNELNM